ncbi:MAG: YhjD/YihY/BrkB family envelope integrity protein [Kiritimatiellia bacterium]|nr:YhjD/YihY/BrkB family envelope integrity protein [Kiritimatiellia bacterium]
MKRALNILPERLTSEVSRLRHALSSAWLVTRESIRTFQLHHAFETAATLSYYALLSLIPLLLLTVFTLSRIVVTSHQALTEIDALSSRFAPDLGQFLLTEVRTLSEQRAWTGISLIALFWLVTPFASTWRAAFDRAFSATQSVTFLRAKLRDLLGTFVILVLFLLVVLGKIAEGTLRSRLAIEIPLSIGRWSFVGAFLLTVLGLMILYAVFGPARPRWAPLAAGALTAATLLFVLRPAFSAFLRFNPNYGFAFGSLKAVFVLIMWGYWSFAVLLFGVEIVSNARRRDTVLLGEVLDPAISRAPSSTLVRKFLRWFEPGQTIFQLGESGETMYVVRSGEVHLKRAGRSLATIAPGGYFGEMTMLIENPRTATAEAGGAGAELIEIQRRNFDLILRENPRIVESMLREFAIRLRDSESTGADLSNSATLSEEEGKKG